jgi:peptide/nickel transport system permease protein
MNWQIWTGGVVLLLLALTALLAIWFSPYEPSSLTAGPALTGPSADHPFGVDTFGRDQLSRCLQGIQISLALGTVVTVAAFLIGTPLGLFSGYLGGLVDSVVGRVLDVVFAFPSILLALVLVAILGPGVVTAGIALTIIYIPIVARYVRAAVLSEREREYVLAARISGTSVFRIARRHLLPNVAASLIPLVTTVYSFIILAEAALSFLGVGAQPPLASLGRILSDNQGVIGTANYLVYIPATILCVIILALTLLGDGLRDAFDPRRSGREPSVARTLRRRGANVR